MTNEHIDDALEKIGDRVSGSMSIGEYVDELLDDPSIGRSSAEYLVDAIEYFGTRTVTEHGEERERYRFFDDPHNDGEHAILGHTDELNSFVEDLRQQAAGDANEEKIFWFEGPTATGKSELKRCIVNGLREYSKTEEGRRYTIEWNAKTGDNSSRITHGPSPENDDDEDWFQSPVQAHPLTVLPRETREEVLSEAGVQNARELAKVGMDPFSEEAVELLEKRYGHDEDAYEQILSDDHLRVVRYTVDVGTGIGMLQAEDSGKPRQKLVGQWMSGMVKELDSRGRRNPQAFSYDGVVSQGNSGVSIIEDAGEHAHMVTKMLNVVDDDVAKLDRRTRLPVDTVFLVISNPGLLEEGATSTERALRRRMERYDTSYLVTVSNEVQLLRRLLTNEYEVWNEYDDERLREPVDVNGTELAPDTVYAVAMFEVLSRISSTSTIDQVDRALLYDRGAVEVDGEEYEIDDVEMDSEDGHMGIPCTYSRDVIADLVAENDVIIPQDAIEAVGDNLMDTNLFDMTIKDKIERQQPKVLDHIETRQEEDVLDAMLRDVQPSEDEVEEYVEHVYCWGTEEDSVEPDDLKMKVFETKYAMFDEDDYDGSTPSQEVSEFRASEIIEGISTWIYQNADEWSIEDGDIPLGEIPVIQEMLDENKWSDVGRIYENFDPTQWDDPLEGTETEELKEKTVENMQDMFGYSEESARRVSTLVVENEFPGDDSGSVQTAVTEARGYGGM